MININDTICALATPAGTSAIAVIRISGEQAIHIVDKSFQNSTKERNILSDAKGYSAHFGKFYNREELIDEVIVTVYKKPHSYTGENSAEISCHGSTYIQQQILQTLIQNGARMANAGEFSLRAFLNGKLDLVQAEAVSDLIESQSKSSHQLALQQLRGGYSEMIRTLREKFVEFASLMELELDFSEEDVEFADRLELQTLLQRLENELTQLVDSFALGNVLKTGIPVAIIGKPNVGKSTLLNVLLNDERAIVSDIPGTTRDTIEDTLNIKGTTFRFIDTAGIRHSEDTIENYGIERTYQAVEKASIILYVVDISQTTIEALEADLHDLQQHVDFNNKKLIIIANKIDLLDETPAHFVEWNRYELVFLSAKRKDTIYSLVETLLQSVTLNQEPDKILVSNLRHYETMQRALIALEKIKEGMGNGIPGDLLAIDIRDALQELGSITGEVTNDEILGNIFGRFCIGK